MINFKDLSFGYNQVPIFRNLNLSLPSHSVSVFLGASGSGKTTFLNLCSGILRPQTGEISGIETHSVSYIFQTPRLLPWLSVRDNIQLVLKGDRVTPQLLTALGIKDLADKRPGELSGGQRQRVAMARAFAYPAQTVLMDEPFQALDVALKRDLIQYFMDRWHQEQRTVLMVTHDIDTALMLGHQIYFLDHQGQVQQVRQGNPFRFTQRSSPEYLQARDQLFLLWE